MLRSFATAAVAGLIATALSSASAGAQAPRTPPPSAPASKDPAAAPAGAYKMDVSHTSVIVRIGYANGFSISTFRIPAKSGTLTWDPAKLEASKVSVVMDPGGIMTPVKGFQEELQGDGFLNVAKFPEASFVSTGVRRTGPNKGQIMGELTLMGQTRPIVIDAEMLGAGKNFRNIWAVGFTGVTTFKRSDFGFTRGVPNIGDQVQLVIDTEFNLPAG